MGRWLRGTLVSDADKENIVITKIYVTVLPPKLIFIVLLNNKFWQNYFYQRPLLSE